MRDGNFSWSIAVIFFWRLSYLSTRHNSWRHSMGLHGLCRECIIPAGINNRDSEYSFPVGVHASLDACSQPGSPGHDSMEQRPWDDCGERCSTRFRGNFHRCNTAPIKEHSASTARMDECRYWTTSIVPHSGCLTSPSQDMEAILYAKCYERVRVVL